MKSRHLLYVLFVFFLGCAQEVSVDQKFVDLFVELRVAEITYGKDSPMGRLVRQNILKDAGYSREQFLAETDEILDNERMWVPFQKAVNVRIDTLLAEPNDEDAAEKKKKRDALKQMRQNMPSHKGGVQ